MKKLVCYFLLSIVFFSCNKDDELGGQNFETENSVSVLLEINVEDNYYEYGITKSIIAITNSEDDLFILDTIENGDNRIYESDFSIQEFNLTIFIEREFEGTDEISYEAQTFIGLTPGQKINFGGIDLNDGSRVDVRVHGAPSVLCNVANSSLGTSSHMNIASLRADMSDPNENLFILLGSDDPLEKRRYIWHENVSEDLNYDVEYDELPIAENEVSFVYPTGVLSTVSGVYGLRDSDDKTKLYGCGCNTVLTHQSELVGFSYPDNIFDEFIVLHSTAVDEDNSIYSLTRFREIEQEYSLPNLRFEINESSSSVIEISSNESYDIWTTGYKVQNEEGWGNPTWKIHGAYDNVVRHDLEQLLVEITSKLGTSVYKTFDEYDRSFTTVMNGSGITIDEFAKNEFDPRSYDFQDLVMFTKTEN